MLGVVQTSEILNRIVKEGFHKKVKGIKNEPYKYLWGTAFQEQGRTSAKALSHGVRIVKEVNVAEMDRKQVD